MNYEKEYNKLVGKIKKAHLYAQTDSTRAVLEDIYPQLAESEGELGCSPVMKEFISKFFEIGNATNFGFGPMKLQQEQPHWKPSDEQLRPLEYAIDYFKKKRNDTTYLESLYNDLKKL